MKKIISLFVIALVFTGAVTFTSNTESHASSNGAPSYSTGSPGDGGNCTDCHIGTATSGGTITSNIPSSGYVAGTTYNFTVSISGSSSNNYGFEVACENSAGAFLGTLSAPGTGAKLITTSHFVTHSTPGTGTSKSWTFAWTAPATSTPTTVTFYAAFLVGNNNGSTSGDVTKNTTKTYTLSTGTPCTMSSNNASQTNVSCNGGSNGAATISASGGTGTLTYSWVPSGGTAATASGLTAGNYTCTVKDANNCSSSQSFTITQPTALSATSSQTNITCNGSTNGAALVNASGGTGTLTYSWAPSGGTSATATNLAAGSYSCTIKDANACSSVKTFTISQPSAIAATITQTNVSCYGSANGLASVSASGGTGSLSYSWSPAGGTTSMASGLNPGNYTCTIKDANSCTKTQTASITQPPALVASISSQTNITSCTVNNSGAASAGATGGTGPYTYAWSPSGGNAATATGLVAGTYTCTVTDSKNCTASQTVTITQSSNSIAASLASQTNVSCNGLANASASVNASGGSGTLTYNWLPSGGTSANATGLSAGTYTCTVKDVNNCTRTQTVTITEPSAISATSSQTNIGCGSTTGAAAVSVGGGTAPYSYNWTPSGGSGSTASGLTAGNYTCTITDAHSCQQTQLFTIGSASTAPVINISSTSNSICNGQSVVLTASGATTYSWSTGATTASISVTPGATSSYSVAGSNGCTGYAVKTITVNPLPTITASSSQSLICSGQSATLTASGALNYTWNGTTSGASIVVNPSATTTYYVMGTSASNCSGYTTFTQYVSICTGIEEANGKSIALNVYPNPNHGIFTLEVQENCHVVMTDLYGRIVWNEVKEPGVYTMQMETINAGIYFISVTNHTGAEHHVKLIKE